MAVFIRVGMLKMLLVKMLQAHVSCSKIFVFYEKHVSVQKEKKSCVFIYMYEYIKV